MYALLLSWVALPHESGYIAPAGAKIRKKIERNDERDMNKKMSKREKDIKSKLMAAISMLLVSSIMMVSTTYAWFTLSTAPEVTGINTAVGANGNLEMALMPTDGIAEGSGNDFGITSDVGDSTKDATVKNITWGNLVDLSSDAFYGMDQIKLYPAALNATMDGENPSALSTGSILKTPGYGADGRVSELLENTTTSTFDKETQNFPSNSKYGVRTVGTASGMTDRELAYRNYRSSASSAIAQAKSTASTSLNANGAILANIVIKQVTDSNAKFGSAEVNSLLNIVNDLLGTDEKSGTLDYIEKAYIDYIIAYGASSAASAMDDDTFKVFLGTVKTKETLDDVVDCLGTYNVTLPDEIAGDNGPIAKLNATKGNVSDAKTILDGFAGREDLTWGDLDTAVSLLANTDSMQINGHTKTEIQADMNLLINSVLNGSNGVVVTITSGGGVYADVADHCGDYSASIEIKDVSYGDIHVDKINATMQADGQAVPYLNAVSAKVEAAGAPAGAGEGGQTMPVSDHYGYIIDLAFRTNAASSSLLLQTDPADRIYTSNTDENAETMGKGSTMTFTSVTNDFTAEQMKSLMEAIRIVFFDPSNGNQVYATAMMDLREGEYEVVGGKQITANIYLYENETATTYELAGEGVTATHIAVPTYVEATGTANPGTHYKDGEEYKLKDDTTPADATLYYIDGYTYEEASEGATHVAKTTTGAHMIETKSESVIAALNQNQAQAVSVLVYLDGESVENEDVAATANTSMTGTMNLQFASSANLVPMNNSTLMTQGDDSGNTN